jgi:hypothetical protein
VAECFAQEMGRDQRGYRVVRFHEGGQQMDVRVSECHAEPARNTGYGVGCGNCRELVPPAVGQAPAPPYAHAGAVTFAGPHAAGWRQPRQPRRRFGFGR